MASVPNRLQKRVFTDGQFTIERRSETQYQATIEGPLGERAGNHFLNWLRALSAKSETPPNIVLDAANIGPVAATVMEDLVTVLQTAALGSLNIFGGQRTHRNLARLKELDGQGAVRFFDNLAVAQGNFNPAANLVESSQESKT